MNLSIINIFGFTQSWGSVIHSKNPLDFNVISVREIATYTVTVVQLR